MSSYPQSTLTVQELPNLFLKYWRFIAVSTLLMMGLFVAAAAKMPKKYKTHFVLTIYAKYFQSPLSGDFALGYAETGELRAQRETLIRQVLTPEYLDSLGERYGIYRKPNAPARADSWLSAVTAQLSAWLTGSDTARKFSLLSREQQDLRDRIEIYSINSTTYYVGFVYNDPDVAFDVANDLYGHIIDGLLELRRQMFQDIRDAIQKRMEMLAAGMSAAAATAAAPVINPVTDRVQQELADLRRQIRALTSEYTDEHPMIKKLRDRERLLVSRLENAPEFEGGPAPVPEKPAAPAPARAEDSRRTLYNDLQTKMNYLTIAMDSDKQNPRNCFATIEAPMYPSAPLWPKKPLLALWGLALGFFGSVFIAAIREHFERSTLHVSQLSERIGLRHLGNLPPLPNVAKE